jgi:hypothetical protein
MRLRPYQRSGIAAVNACFARGTKRVLAVAPTGAGKGTMATAMIVDAAKRDERVLFVVHSREIVHDLRERLAASGCPLSVVTTSTVQSLLAGKRKAYDLVVVDEAHHYRAVEWQRVIEGTGKRARMVGFTATPQRSDGRAMGNVFGELVDVVSYSQLLASGHIVPCRVLMPPRPLSGAVALHSADAYQRYARGTPALVFERDVKTARSSLAAFNAAGISAELIVDSTKREQREAAFARLRSGATRVLVNVYVLTEGVDLPCVQTIVLARGCEHAGPYMQIVGRALRAAPGKSGALLIDLVGASYLHGEPTVDREYALIAREGVIREAGKPRTVPVYVEDTRQAQVPLGLDLVPFTPELRAASVVAIGKRTSRTFLRGFDWSTTNIGKKADLIVADETGFHLRTIVRVRQRLGIPAHNAVNMDELQSHLFGTMPDEEHAKIVGARVSTIRHERKKRGILGYSRQARAHALAVSDPDLGIVAADVIAKRHGISVATVYKAHQTRGIPLPARGRDWQWEKQPLGLVEDETLAKRLGCSRSLVVQAREKRGIPVYRPASNRVSWDSVSLGQDYDRVYAEQLGVSASLVALERKKRGIPPFDPRRRPRSEAAE